MTITYLHAMKCALQQISAYFLFETRPIAVVFMLFLSGRFAIDIQITLLLN